MNEQPNQSKDCPFCGEQINVKAIKCKHCHSMLNEQSAVSGATKDCPLCGEKIAASDTKCSHCESDLKQGSSGGSLPVANNEAKLVALIMDFHKRHRAAHPLPQKQEPKTGVMGFINKAIANSTLADLVVKGPSEVAFLDEITHSVLRNHEKYASQLNPASERPLFVVNTTCGMTQTGLILTTQHVYYSVKPAKSLMMGLGSNIVGCIPLRDIRGIKIGAHDTALGSAYNGHDFYLNGQKLGWLRMGTGMLFDNEVLECTTELFGTLTSEIFSLD